MATMAPNCTHESSTNGQVGIATVAHANPNAGVSARASCPQAAVMVIGVLAEVRIRFWLWLWRCLIAESNIEGSDLELVSQILLTKDLSQRPLTKTQAGGPRALEPFGRCSRATGPWRLRGRAGLIRGGSHPHSGLHPNDEASTGQPPASSLLVWP